MDKPKGFLFDEGFRSLCKVYMELWKQWRNIYVQQGNRTDKKGRLGYMFCSYTIRTKTCF